MKITKVESLHADAGQRNFDFLKISTDEGIAGWSEYNEAFVPNVRIMEIDPDTVPWYDELVTAKPRIEQGHLLLPPGPGWGTEVNEEAVRAQPPRKR